MFVSSIGLVILILVLLAVLPRWPYSGSWGNTPSIIVGVLIAFLIVYMLTGHVAVH